jgi:NAD(P)-dependent dehydrogenase (short-subunit alcohol dehydrogenase family)
MTRLKDKVAVITGGSIIITSSVAGLRGGIGMSAYVASKHAVIGIMRSAGIECGPMGIRVNTVNPGPIETPMVRSLESSYYPRDPERGKKVITSGTALKRYGTPEEVAALMLFLAGDESRYCTGGVYMVDGGLMD